MSAPTAPKKKGPPQIGLLKGLGVTLKTFLSKPTTQQYPKTKPDLAPRTRGVIALMEENCTVCMLCARECPDWCIYIDSHKETVPPKDGGRARTRNILDRFAIDFALCMYCGICVEVCPFDALFWSPEFEYSTETIEELTHEKEQLRKWMDTVPPPPELEYGAELPKEIQQGLDAARKKAAQRAAATAAAAPAKDDAEQDSGEKKEVEQRLEDTIHVEAQIDQDVFDKLVAEGKSERVARAKAKAAYVRAEKKRQADEIRAKEEG
ncbi:NuoI/complex I 23 kDa subunit family protein [Euzebya tangerina]|uniref:NuoI/complex I 23 kDa subunit family protein n=1 Tax=Euzebya tangerina TaxID=591198 RepID=UPI000E31A2F8|nr:NADH-quinone oxidoreductase subunit I [Euzebya tangerina]